MYFHCSKRLHHSHIIQIIVDLLLHHTSSIPAPSVLAVHHSQAREALGGLFFLTRGILFQDVAVGWVYWKKEREIQHSNRCEGARARFLWGSDASKSEGARVSRVGRQLKS